LWARLGASRAGDFREFPLRETYGWRQIAMANPKPGMGPIEYASKILNIIQLVTS
jgi:hypothetical protein